MARAVNPPHLWWHPSKNGPVFPDIKQDTCQAMDRQQGTPVWNRIYLHVTSGIKLPEGSFKVLDRDIERGRWGVLEGSFGY